MFIPRHRSTANQSLKIIHNPPLPLLHTFSPQCPYRSWQKAVWSWHQKAVASGAGHSKDEKLFLQDRNPVNFESRSLVWDKLQTKWCLGRQMGQKSLCVMGTTWKSAQEQVRLGRYCLCLNWTWGLYGPNVRWFRVNVILRGLFSPQTSCGMKMDWI